MTEYREEAVKQLAVIIYNKIGWYEWLKVVDQYIDIETSNQAMNLAFQICKQREDMDKRLEALEQLTVESQNMGLYEMEGDNV